MGTYAIVEPRFADLIINELGLDIGREQRNAITKATGVRVKTAEIVIILDDKAMTANKKTSYVYSKSDYVIATDGSKNFHLAVRYAGDDEKAEDFEPLKENKESADKRKDKLNQDIEQKNNQINFLKTNIREWEQKRDDFKNEISELQEERDDIEKERNEAEEEYEKLVDKIERLRKNLLIRVLFHLYKLELE